MGNENVEQLECDFRGTPQGEILSPIHLYMVIGSLLIELNQAGTRSYDDVTSLICKRSKGTFSKYARTLLSR